MDTQRIASVLLSYMYLIDIAASEDALCYNSETAVYECCQDYKNVSGTCEACIGFWGKDCGNNCSYGYYGHGCRTKCNCGHQQICDPKQGCLACIGSWGKNSGKNCGYGYYGHGCRTKCNCRYQQICDPIIGCIADNSVDEPGKLTNCSDMEKVYNILTSAHGINICYNSMTEKIECCAGFTNITGICEKNVENFTEKVEFTTNNADGPQTHMNFKGFPYATGYVNMTWISGFKGDYKQFFVLYLIKASDWKVIGNITEPAEDKLARFDPGYLTPDQEYRFHLKTCNIVNCSEHSAEFELTFTGNSRGCSEERQEKEEEELFGGYAILIICVLSALLGSTWLIVAVLVIYKSRRGNLHQSSTRDTHNIRLETQGFTGNYEDAQFTDAWDMYTELGNPYQGIPDTTYEQPKM